MAFLDGVIIPGTPEAEEFLASFPTIVDGRFNKAHDKLGKFASTNGTYVKGSDRTEDLVAATMDGNNMPYDHGDINDPREHVLAYVSTLNGFDGKPTKGSVDEVVKAGGLEIHRGLIPNRRTGESAEVIEGRFRDGAYEPGRGNYGAGFYFTTQPGVAKMYASKPVADGGYNAKLAEGGLVVRAALRPGAKIIDYDSLHKEHSEWWQKSIKERIFWDTHSNNYQIPEGKVGPWVSDVAMDPGRFAALRGYDAIRIPLKNRDSDRRNKKRIQRAIGSDDLGDEILVLNRTALVVDG